MLSRPVVLTATPGSGRSRPMISNSQFSLSDGKTVNGSCVVGSTLVVLSGQELKSVRLARKTLSG